jgi:glycerophosphoryl diester phosphodiesterase
MKQLLNKSSMKKLLCLLIVCVIAACASVKKNSITNATAFDFEAHRGGRGLMPENTIAAMLNTISMKDVVTLEMDVHITKDGLVVVSHDPYFNYLITTTPEGKYLTAQEAQKTILYQMNYAAIKKYDVGMKPHPDFPRQQKIAAYKPLLADLVDAAEAEARSKQRTIYYNIEIKSKKTTDNINHPEPELFVEKLVAVLKQKNILNRCVVQSFDPRPLQVLHKIYPNIKTSFLVDRDGGDKVLEQLNKLGFTPDIYSPAFSTVSQQVVNICHTAKMKIVPWTVNTKEEIQNLVDMGVDGIISDYPDLFSQVKLK